MKLRKSFCFSLRKMKKLFFLDKKFKNKVDKTIRFYNYWKNLTIKHLF